MLDRNFVDIKGIVRRDLTGVKNGPKRQKVIICKTGNVFFQILQGHHYEKSVNWFQRLNNNWTELAGQVYKILQTTGSVLSTYRACAGWWLCSTAPVPYNHQPAQVFDNQPAQLNSVNVRYGSAPYNHTTVQVLCRAVISRRRRDFFKSHILARSSYLVSQSSYLASSSS
jgi:hypothetical protein